MPEREKTQLFHHPSIGCSNGEVDSAVRGRTAAGCHSGLAKWGGWGYRFQVRSGLILRAWKSTSQGRQHEPGSSTCGDTEGRVCADRRWRAQGLEGLGAALCGVGDLSREGIAGGPGQALRVAEFGVVWAGRAALR